MLLVQYDGFLGIYEITPYLNGVRHETEYFSSYTAAKAFIDMFYENPYAALFAQKTRAHLNRLYSNTINY